MAHAMWELGTEEQRRTLLPEIATGHKSVAFGLTEPDYGTGAGMGTTAVREGDEYVINGRKWWSTGAAEPRCQVMIVMGKTDPAAAPYRQQSMILVPMDTPGVRIVRSLPVFGYHDQAGHAEVQFTDVRVPAANLIAAAGDGFAIAQARLGPGRIHHCMRSLGLAERALELMCGRATARVAFGGPIADQGVVAQYIAESRMAIDQARLLTLRAAWRIDKQGTRAARDDVAAIKVVVPRVALDVLDRAIQVHGAAGVSDDVPLARWWAGLRTLRIADGPDEVHIRTVARAELRPYRAAAAESAP
jgi:acyl-CoA dehydrogenase